MLTKCKARWVRKKSRLPGEFEIDMIKKMTVFVGAATCMGLVVIFVPGVAREIAAEVMPFGKMQLGIEDDGLVIRQPDAACPHHPWPYGCDWRARRKQVVKKVRTRHQRLRCYGALILEAKCRAQVGDCRWAWVERNLIVHKSSINRSAIQGGICAWKAPVNSNFRLAQVAL
jgi:hypothetical protein